MSNLSDVGFPVKSEQDVNDVIMSILNNLEAIPCPPLGYYFKFQDKSGAEIYLQTNSAQEIMGFNPAFDGKSKRKVGLTEKIERDTSPLDGAFHAWANPSDENFENSGEYPFVFDVPNFRTFDNLELPSIQEIQLTAFASNDLKLFENEDAFSNSQNSKPKFASKSFIPSGLFNVAESETPVPPQAHGIFAGEIVDFDLRTNEFTDEKFYWFLVKTLGGEIDVVADVNLIKTEPQKDGILHGSFWLSGKILN